MADIDSLKQALAVSPGNVPLLILLAEAQLESFFFGEAHESVEAALKIEPENSRVRLLQAQILEFEGKSSEAILRLEQLTQSQPTYGLGWLTLAKMLLGDGSPQDARAAYDRAISAESGLRDEELLKRIIEAGGKGSVARGKLEANPFSETQAGALYDPDFDEDDSDDTDEVYGALDELDVDFETSASVDFSDVGGMDAVKEDIRMKILYPLENPALFEAYGKKPGGGVLLYGPPGCGKTLISRATAGEIDASFLSVGLHQILDMWMGKSEEKLHEIFEMARRQAPAVLFFDEVDAIAADRKDLRNSAGRTLINQFLAELDSGASNNDGILVLGATNAPWHLDSAFMRPGRFDRIIFVPPPDLPAREEIVRLMADGKPVAGLEPAALAKKLESFSGADIKATFDQAIEASLSEAMKSGKIVPVTQKQLVKSARGVKPSTRKWFESAKNHALYANQAGLYDDVLDFLNIKR